MNIYLFLIVHLKRVCVQVGTHMHLWWSESYFQALVLVFDFVEVRQSLSVLHTPH